MLTYSVIVAVGRHDCVKVSRHIISVERRILFSNPFSPPGAVVPDIGQAFRWQPPPATRPLTTFGSGTREQATYILAPGLKRGARCQHNRSYPGPGVYDNIPSSLGHQVSPYGSSELSWEYEISNRKVCKSWREGSVVGDQYVIKAKKH